MTIDVLIPSYNRAHYVSLQLASLKIIRERLAAHDIDLRAVVSDNMSNPPVEIPAEYLSMTIVVRPAQHLPTAEENVFFGVEKCTADYVWLLGDDDAPIIPNAVELLRELNVGRPDFMVTNATGLRVGNGWTTSRTRCSNELAIKSLPDFVQRTGFTFVLAGFSCIVFRRDKIMARANKFPEYFRTSNIYSLVFWMLDAFWDGSFKYSNRPIVVYKQNQSDLDGKHWIRVAARLDVFQRYFWTLGLVRLFQKLIDEKKIPTGFLSSALEQNFDSRFPVLGLALGLFLEQLRDEANPKYAVECRKTTPEEREEFFQFVIREEPRYLEVYAPLAAKRNLSAGQIEVCRNFVEKQLKYFYRSYFIEEVAGWQVYYYDSIYRAFPSAFIKRLADEYMDIAPIESEYQLVAPKREEIIAKIWQRPLPKWPSHGFREPVKLLDGEMRVLRKWVRLLITIKKMMPQNLLHRFVKIFSRN